MNKYFLPFFLLICPLLVTAQNCAITISGQVLDKGTNAPLEYANIYIEESETGDVSDENGSFEIKKLCNGNYHFRISHIGCHTEHHFISVEKDTTLIFYLGHHSELLNEVEIHGHANENSNQISNSIDQNEIAQQSNKNLSDLIENIAGVSVLKSGGGISKPIIHGLYGNRISILNNEIVQSGQQWGNDHAPEIDPFIADHISVIKGAAALEYSGSSLGSIILVEMDKIKEDPHLHGTANYIFNSNGLGHTANVKLEKYSNWAAWRVIGTTKFQGDFKAPNYYLTNTGKREYNVAATLQKDFSPRWKGEFYYSFFHTLNRYFKRFSC